MPCMINEMRLLRLHGSFIDFQDGIVSVLGVPNTVLCQSVIVISYPQNQR